MVTVSKLIIFILNHTATTAIYAYLHTRSLHYSLPFHTLASGADSSPPCCLPSTRAITTPPSIVRPCLAHKKGPPCGGPPVPRFTCPGERAGQHPCRACPDIVNARQHADRPRS